MNEFLTADRSWTAKYFWITLIEVGSSHLYALNFRKNSNTAILPVSNIFQRHNVPRIIDQFTSYPHFCTVFWFLFFFSISVLFPNFCIFPISLLFFRILHFFRNSVKGFPLWQQIFSTTLYRPDYIMHHNATLCFITFLTLAIHSSVL